MGGGDEVIAKGMDGDGDDGDGNFVMDGNKRVG
jgi:hypothetical protein